MPSAGGLDLTFGGGDGLTTAFRSADFKVLARPGLQADGRIVVLGEVAGQFVVARYNADGSPDDGSAFDTTPGDRFGTAGSYALGISSNTFGDMAVQPDGKVVVVSTAGGKNQDFLAYRLRADGTGPDLTFGSGGTATMDFTPPRGKPTADQARAVVVQADGKLVVVGMSRVGSVSGGANERFALARLNANGSLDTGFGSGGKVITDINPAEGTGEIASAVALQGGKVIAGGMSTELVGPTGQQVRVGYATLVRYNANGTLDTTFGSGGVARHDVSPDYLEAVTGLAVQADGKILATPAYGGVFQVVRYTVDGTLDGSFGTGGVARVDLGTGTAAAVAVQSDGKIIAVGAANTGGVAATQKTAVVRFNTDGSLDGTFGTGGVATFDFGTAAERAWSVVLQPDGRIVIAGVARDGSSGEYSWVLARLLA